MDNILYEIRELSFAYNDFENDALSDISFDINQGDFIVVCGPSGCGKTTLLRHLKSSMIPKGKSCGSVHYMGTEISLVEERKQATDIGYIFQNPESQIVTDYVWSELAFGLESLGYSNTVIRQKVADVASYYGLHDIYEKSTEELSGGEKQLVNLAAVMVMNPTTLILDEPVSRLDPISASRYIDTLGRLNRELGITIVISSHNLEELLPLSTHLLIMDRGRLVNVYEKSEYQKMVNECGMCVAEALPVESKLYTLTDGNGECPFGLTEGRKWLKKLVKDKPEYSKRSNNLVKSKVYEDEVVSFKNVYYGYSRDKDVIKNMTCHINKGEVYGIIGSNGSGKSTFLSLMSGILKPSYGKISIHEEYKIALLPQKPELLFRKRTVRQELECIDFNENIKDSVICQCDLTELLDKNPFDLSGGERQRVALAIVLMTDADIILMDEPSKGMDAISKNNLVRLINELSENGKTIVVVSHDIEFVAECTDRCGMLFDGAIVSEAATSEFLLNNNYYTTPVVRLTRGIIDGCVRISDILGCRTNEINDICYEKNNAERNVKCNTKRNTKYNAKCNTKRYGKRDANCNANCNTVCNHKCDIQNNTQINVLMMFIYVIIIPATVWFGTAVLQDRKYYFIALMIVLESMVPFYINYERKKYSAETVVIVAVLCAIAVASRAAFYMLPAIKPIVAVVIISAVAMGGELGFIIGSLSMLVSNVLFGQGVWTPWQMFAMGMVGLLSGLLFHRYRYRINRLWLCITGFLLTVVIYGGIVDMSTLFYINDAITIKVIIATYVAGLPFNLILAGTTVIFLWIMAKPFLDKILRLVQ